MKNCTPLIECPITGESNCVTYFDLGNFPLVNNLHSTQKESLNCTKYPLKVNFFPNSQLSALSHAVDGELLFSNYLFKTGVNKPYIEHSKNMFDEISKVVFLEENDLVVDIGGNDGTLLETFRDRSSIPLQYLNIDPSVNLTQECRDKGILALTSFFNSSTYKEVNSKAKIIVSTNVFQHLLDINSFTKGVYNLLEENGIWVLEFPYWTHDLETLQFDQVYHEHMYYYSISPLNQLMDKHNLKIIDIQPQKIHGGTLRLTIAQKSSSYSVSPLIQEYLNKESVYDLNFYQKWGEQIHNQTKIWRDKILELKSQNKKVVAFGAAAKGCIFLNSLNLTYNEISYVIDDTDIKQNKYIPGTGIPIVSREILQSDFPDYIIILAHNFSDYIIKSLPKYKGQFITFLPEYKVISNLDE